MKEIIAFAVLFLLCIFAFFMSIRSFKEKGFLFNNAYIYANSKEREKMNKKPYYRQSGVVFLLIGIIFMLNSFSMLLKIEWLSYLVIPIMIFTVIYAIVSSVIIERNNKKE